MNQFELQKIALEVLDGCVQRRLGALKNLRLANVGRVLPACDTFEGFAYEGAPPPPAGSKLRRPLPPSAEVAAALSRAGLGLAGARLGTDPSGDDAVWRRLASAAVRLGGGIEGWSGEAERLFGFFARACPARPTECREVAKDFADMLWGIGTAAVNLSWVHRRAFNLELLVSLLRVAMGGPEEENEEVVKAVVVAAASKPARPAAAPRASARAVTLDAQTVATLAAAMPRAVSHHGSRLAQLRAAQIAAGPAAPAALAAATPADEPAPPAAAAAAPPADEPGNSDADFLDDTDSLGGSDLDD